MSTFGSTSGSASLPPHPLRRNRTVAPRRQAPRRAMRSTSRSRRRPDPTHCPARRAEEGRCWLRLAARPGGNAGAGGRARVADDGEHKLWRQLPLAPLQLTSDFPVVARHFRGNPPHVDRSEHGYGANSDLGRAWSFEILAPVPSMAAEGQARDGGVDVLRHVHVDVAEEHDYRHRGFLPMDLRLSQIEIDIAQRTTGDCPAPELEPSPLDDVGEEPSCETRGVTPRSAGRGFTDRWQSGANPLEIRSDPSSISLLDPLRELLQGESTRQ